jgi:hypothetical protein
LSVPVADLGDGGHVDGVVHPPVPAQRQPVDDAVPEDTSTAAVPLQPPYWILAGEARNFAGIAGYGVSRCRAAPKIPVTALPEVWTAAASLRLTSRR